MQVGLRMLVFSTCVSLLAYRSMSLRDEKQATANPARSRCKYVSAYAQLSPAHALPYSPQR